MRAASRPPAQPVRLTGLARRARHADLRVTPSSIGFALPVCAARAASRCRARTARGAARFGELAWNSLRVAGMTAALAVVLAIAGRLCGQARAGRAHARRRAALLDAGLRGARHGACRRRAVAARRGRRLARRRSCTREPACAPGLLLTGTIVRADLRVPGPAISPSRGTASSRRSRASRPAMDAAARGLGAAHCGHAARACMRRCSRARAAARAAARVRRRDEGAAGDARAATVQFRHAGHADRTCWRRTSGSPKPRCRRWRSSRSACCRSLILARDAARIAAAGTAPPDPTRIAGLLAVRRVAPDAPGRTPLLPAGAVERHLRRRRVLAQRGDRQRIGLERAERFELGILRHRRPAPPAIRCCRWRSRRCASIAREILEELDRVLAMRRVLQHAGAGDVDVRAVARLVGTDDAGLRDDFACPRAWSSAAAARSSTCSTSAIAHSPAATALIWSVSPPLRRARHVGDHAFAHASAFASPLCAISEPISDRLYGWLPERVQILPLFRGSASDSYVATSAGFTSRLVVDDDARAATKSRTSCRPGSRIVAGMRSSSVADLTGWNRPCCCA